ncbi:RHS repeat domain-containing protein [Flavobacterium sp. '19STA2R22 D10 B1']|uniref:RHS repeat domain-containing protein n=1 Tax=Flavobacterium aerium TaxID=3037261 RepID=UPI00278C3572|nr:RHS repeat domain-containing protein [Flavobacterium sp. '19STA2R22 D10 B1']
MTQTKDFFYDNPVHLEPTRITTTDSKGNTYRTKMIYADDIASPTFLAGPALTNEEWYAVYTMKSNALHRIAEPIQTETTMNDAATFSVQRTAFQNWGNDLILPKKVLVSKGDLEIENRIAYNAYDSKGNPQELQQEKGTPIVYLWGYNKSLPIAKIENATAAQVATALGTDINGLQNYNETHIGTLNNLRNSLAEAMVTTYSYIPQIGIRTITDPKGQTTTYEYDTFNRLQKIKDFQGNVIKENQYNYAPN